MRPVRGQGTVVVVVWKKLRMWHVTMKKIALFMKTTDMFTSTHKEIGWIPKVLKNHTTEKNYFFRHHRYGNKICPEISVSVAIKWIKPSCNVIFSKREWEAKRETQRQKTSFQIYLDFERSSESQFLFVSEWFKQRLLIGRRRRKILAWCM